MFGATFLHVMHAYNAWPILEAPPMISTALLLSAAAVFVQAGASQCAANKKIVFVVLVAASMLRSFVLAKPVPRASQRQQAPRVHAAWVMTANLVVAGSGETVTVSVLSSQSLVRLL
jgi:hypothetical protein